MANWNFRVGKIIRTEAELDAFLASVDAATGFTDEHGNPVEVDNHPVRSPRSPEDIARHEERVSERPQHPYRGFIPAPEVYSTLEGGMVPTGVDLYQCEICGFWMSRKMTPSQEREHDRQCRRY